MQVFFISWFITLFIVPQFSIIWYNVVFLLIVIIFNYVVVVFYLLYLLPLL